MTVSKTGNKKVRRQSLQRVKTPEWAILEAAPAAFFRCRPSHGFPFSWSDDRREEPSAGTKVSFRGRVSHPITPSASRDLVFPEYTPRCQRKGCRSFLAKIEAVFPCFLCFWKPSRLTTKPFVLLNTPVRVFPPCRLS